MLNDVIIRDCARRVKGNVLFSELFLFMHGLFISRALEGLIKLLKEFTIYGSAALVTSDCWVGGVIE